MQKSEHRVLLIVATVLGSFILLFSSGRSLADVFFFIGSLTAIASYLRLREIREDVDDVKRRVSERIEEIEYRLENPENSLKKV